MAHYAPRQKSSSQTVHQNGATPVDRLEPGVTGAVQGAAAALGVTPQTVFKWLHKGRLTGRQLTKGQPWQITLADEQITSLAAQVRLTSRSTKEAS